MKPQNMFEQECLSAGGMHPSQIAPFERLVASSDLDGRHGKRRVREGCKIPVESDLEAVQYWIQRTSESDSTARMRRGVAEKLFNWAYVQLKKPLSQFEREDFGAFVAFTANPCPADVWIAPRGTMRNSTAWRPFAGPADASSQAAISSNISSLLKFLRQQNYADLQYVHGKRAAREGCADSRFACQREAGANQTEVMPLREWEWVTRHFDMNEGNGKVRLERIVAELLYYAGMKLCDVAAMSQSELWTP